MLAETSQVKKILDTATSAIISKNRRYFEKRAELDTFIRDFEEDLSNYEESEEFIGGDAYSQFIAKNPVQVRELLIRFKDYKKLVENINNDLLLMTTELSQQGEDNGFDIHIKFQNTILKEDK